MTTARAARGRLVWLEDEATPHDIEDGICLMAEGRIVAAGATEAVRPLLPPGTEVDDWRPCLILPGLIDPHIHYPQTQVIASYGAQLLEWLQRYTFVEEQRFADPAHATAVARFFLDELLRNGTTTAAVYCTVHTCAAEAFFAEAAQRRLRMIAGRVMMDRGAPAGLLDTAEQGYAQSRDLIARWHGQGRLGYAITPRFAPTSTPAQLAAAGALAREHPDCWVQTHLAESRQEIAAVAELFPARLDYTDVYDHYGLLGPRTLLGHCIHLGDRELARLAATRSIAVFCPTSNLFIGSGLLDLARLRAADVPTALATDVGGGTSYSMLRTAGEAYKVLQLQGQSLHPFTAFWQMTRGNAQALGLGDRLGSLSPDYEADLVVLDPAATPAMAHRSQTLEGDLAGLLFLLMTLGDDRAVRAVYVAGDLEPCGGDATLPPVIG